MTTREHDTVTQPLPPSGVRTRGHRVDTPVLTYRHASGRTITIVGTLHFAPRPYFDALNGIIRDREAAGALVHYEHTTHDDFPDDSKRTPCWNTSFATAVAPSGGSLAPASPGVRRTRDVATEVSERCVLPEGGDHGD